MPPKSRPAPRQPVRAAKKTAARKPQPKRVRPATKPRSAAAAAARHDPQTTRAPAQDPSTAPPWALRRTPAAPPSRSKRQRSSEPQPAQLSRVATGPTGAVQAAQVPSPVPLDVTRSPHDDVVRFSNVLPHPSHSLPGAFVIPLSTEELPQTSQTLCRADETSAEAFTPLKESEYQAVVAAASASFEAGSPAARVVDANDGYNPAGRPSATATTGRSVSTASSDFRTIRSKPIPVCDGEQSVCDIAISPLTARRSWGQESLVVFSLPPVAAVDHRPLFGHPTGDLTVAELFPAAVGDHANARAPTAAATGTVRVDHADDDDDDDDERRWFPAQSQFPQSPRAADDADRRSASRRMTGIGALLNGGRAPSAESVPLLLDDDDSDSNLTHRAGEHGTPSQASTPRRSATRQSELKVIHSLLAQTHSRVNDLMFTPMSLPSTLSPVSSLASRPHSTTNAFSTADVPPALLRSDYQFHVPPPNSFGRGMLHPSQTRDRCPSERPSTQLISRAAARRPEASPATFWININDDDNNNNGDEDNDDVVDDNKEIGIDAEDEGPVTGVLIELFPSQSAAQFHAGGPSAGGGSMAWSKVAALSPHRASAEAQSMARVSPPSQQRIRRDPFPSSFPPSPSSLRPRSDTSGCTSPPPLLETPHADHQTVSPVDRGPLDKHAQSWPRDHGGRDATVGSLGLTVAPGGEDGPATVSDEQSKGEGHPNAAAKRETIADALRPTFRPRKGALQPNKPPPRNASPPPDGYLLMDDDSDSDYGRVCEANPTDVAFPRTACVHTPAAVKAGHSHSPPSALEATLPYVDSKHKLYILDDDTENEAEADEEPVGSPMKPLATVAASTPLGGVEGGESPIPCAEDVTRASPLAGAPKSSACVASEVRPDHSRRLSRGLPPPGRQMSVKDALFSNGKHLDDEESAVQSHQHVTTHRQSLGKNCGSVPTRPRGDGKMRQSRTNPLTEADDRGDDCDDHDERPVHRLRYLYPSKFTKKGYLEAVERVVTKPHCLQPGEFWEAFESAEYVGEGSFGLVWRCRTVDGDDVAVKSCPVSFASRAAIDDAYSVLREIAIMRFLNDRHVPYVLPLHSSFFVLGREALPPNVLRALLWRKKLDRAAEELRIQQRMASLQAKYGRHRRARALAKSRTKAGESATDVAALAAAAQQQRVPLDEGEAMEQLCHATVRLPKFLSITDLDALESDATVFLVTELCDGDVESIERYEGITKGIAYCVSTALTEMHRLGLLHLDLKPSNILFAYDRQQRGANEHLSEASATDRSGSGRGVELTLATASVPSLPVPQSGESQAPRGTQANGRATARTKPPLPSAVKFYLSDFGNCQIAGPSYLDEVKDTIGTYEYMDRLALESKVTTRATDCYSLGATLYELLTCHRLYPPCQRRQCVSEEDHTRHCYVEASKQSVEIPCKTTLQHVTAALLHAEPRQRMTAAGCRAALLAEVDTRPSSPSLTR